jgi:hypothetical protein
VGISRLLNSSSVLALLACAAIVGVLPACSEAETPAAYFDAGGRPDGGFSPFDAGPGRGGRDQPCVRGRCSNNDLICVSENDGDGGTTDVCRLSCDLGDDTDPCGLGATCGRLTDMNGACLPAGVKDESCPCDEGFTCVAPMSDGGPATICKTACDASPDAGVQPCAVAETCTRLSNSPTAGACI